MADTIDSTTRRAVNGARVPGRGAGPADPDPPRRAPTTPSATPAQSQPASSRPGLPRRAPTSRASAASPRSQLYLRRCALPLEAGRVRTIDDTILFVVNTSLHLIRSIFLPVRRVGNHRLKLLFDIGECPQLLALVLEDPLAVEDYTLLVEEVAMGIITDDQVTERRPLSALDTQHTVNRRGRRANEAIWLCQFYYDPKSGGTLPRVFETPAAAFW
jgi:hypothetical protein